MLKFLSKFNQPKMPAAILVIVGAWVTIAPVVLKHSRDEASYNVSGGQFWQTLYSRVK